MGNLKNPVKVLPAVLYAACGDSEKNSYWVRNYNKVYPVHRQNNVLDLTYDFLAAFGYELSDTEKALKDGTHPLLQEETPPKEQSVPEETVTEESTLEEPAPEETASDGANIESGPVQTET